MPPAVDVASEKKKVVAFLQTHDPTKVGLADELLKRFVAEGQPGMDKMWASLRKRYNVADPGSPSAAVKSPLAASTSAAPPKSVSGSAAAPSPKAGAAPGGKAAKPTAAASPTKSAAVKEKPAAAATATKTPKKAEPSAAAKEDQPSSSAEKGEKKAASAAASKKPRASVAGSSPPKNKGGAAVHGGDDDNDDGDKDAGPASAKGGDSSASSQKERLRRYFQKYLPERLPQLDVIAERVSASDKKTGTAWSELFASLTSKFGPEDSSPSGTPSLVPQKSAVSSVLSPRGGPASPSSSHDMVSSIPKSLHSFVQFPTSPKQQPVGGNATQHGSFLASPRLEKPLGSTVSSEPSPPSQMQSTDAGRRMSYAAPSVSEADLDKSDGQTMTTKEDRRRRDEEQVAETQQWVERLTRYFQHYDPAKSEDDIRSAVSAAQQTPNGLQQLWEALVQHYGPEPPQPIAKMFQLLSASTRQRVVSPQDVAKALINSSSATGGGASGGADQSSGSSGAAGVPTSEKSSRNAAGGATAAPSSSAAQQKPKWYLEEDDATHPSKLVTTTLPIVGQREYGKPSTFTSSSLAGAEGTPYDVAQRSQVSGVNAATTILFGVMRFVGLDYRLYESATEAQRFQFVRAMEQELSYAMDCDPSAITVRRIIPNTAADFKIDLTEAVRRGSQGARNAQHMGDVLVNRVLNGTLSLRLVRDSYRRDLGGVASSVYPQSCAVFGNESQQYYSLVPDELPSAPLPPGDGGADSRYAAFAAAPPSTQYNPRDLFGTPPALSNNAKAPYGSRPGPRGEASRPDVDALANRLHHMAELERIGKGATTTFAAATANGERGTAVNGAASSESFPPAAGVRPNSRPVASAARPHSSGGGYHDFGSRVWDDDASEVADYGRREETAQYTFHKPERISATAGWNRLLESFADPNKTVLDSAGLRGARFVPAMADEQYRHDGAYLPDERRSPTNYTTSGQQPSRMPLRGLEAVRSRSSPSRARTIFGGGERSYGNGSGSPRGAASSRNQQAPRATSPRERSAERSPRTQWMYKSYDRTSPPPSFSRPQNPSPPREGQRRSPMLQILTSGDAPRLLEPQVRSTTHHHRPPTSTDDYRGFGRDVPEIRDRAVGGGSGAFPSAEYAHPPQKLSRHVVPAVATYEADRYDEPHALFMEREGQRRQAINVETVREPRWPADSFSREYHRIMSS